MEKGRTEVSARLPAGLAKGLQHQLDLQLRTHRDPPRVLTSELNGKTAPSEARPLHARGQPEGTNTRPGELLESSFRAC